MVRRTFPKTKERIATDFIKPKGLKVTEIKEAHKQRLLTDTPIR